MYILGGRGEGYVKLDKRKIAQRAERSHKNDTIQLWENVL